MLREAASIYYWKYWLSCHKTDFSIYFNKKVFYVVDETYNLNSEKFEEYE